MLDLFSGCGGLSLGFLVAGSKITAAVESDPTAAASYATNFHGGDSTHAVGRDIITTTPGDLVKTMKLGKVAEAFDVVVGGPPCQAFARVGRSKLREIHARPDAFRHDPRATLFSPYIRYVKSCCPLAILIENVPDVMNFGGHNVPEEVCEVLEDLGYVSAYTLLNAAFYGVPQTRERMFLVAYHRKIADHVSFPAPTHWIDLPRGYEHSRRVALRVLSNRDLFSEPHRYLRPPEATKALPTAITAKEAIGDLPIIDTQKMMQRGELKRGVRRFNDVVPYDEIRTVSEYALSMKSWPGFEAGHGIRDHVIRYLPRDYALFARMKEGDQYPEAHAIALKMFEEELSRLEGLGIFIMHGSPEYYEKRSAIVPPYDAGKFPNKWRKIARHQPVRTIMAHLEKDGYSHIHYDSAQARTISVREAARLQSFPDGFVFSGSMNQAFRQIGNAVPPLLAQALATEIMNTIQPTECSFHRREPCRSAVVVAPVVVSGLSASEIDLAATCHQEDRTADVLTTEQRRAVMSRIRGKDTKPELILRRGLHQRGLRYRIHCAEVPGTPDLVFPRHRTAVFVHGCFWHGHGCSLFRWPKTRAAFWRTKITRTIERDQSVMSTLRANGWRALVVWECALRGRYRRPIQDTLNIAEAFIRGHRECVAEIAERGHTDTHRSYWRVSRGLQESLGRKK